MANRKQAESKKVDKKEEEKSSVSVSEELWEKIKNLPLDLYGLPNQTVQGHVVRHKEMERAVPDALHLTLKSGAVLPALEETLGRFKFSESAKYEISSMSKFTVVRSVPKDQ